MIQIYSVFSIFRTSSIVDRSIGGECEGARPPPPEVKASYRAWLSAWLGKSLHVQTYLALTAVGTLQALEGELVG